MIEIERILAAQSDWIAAAQHGGDIASLAAARSLCGLHRAMTVLRSNLRDIGYPNVPVLVEPPTEFEALLRRLESGTRAKVPPALAACWWQVGGIALVDLHQYAHAGFWEDHGVFGLFGFSDGLYLQEFTEAWVDEAIADWQVRRQAPEPWPEEELQFEFAPDGYHKDGVSGGPPYGLRPGRGWLAPITNFS